MSTPAQPVAVTMAPDASWAVTVAADGSIHTWGAGLALSAVRLDVGEQVAVAMSGTRLRVLWAASGSLRLHETAEGGPLQDKIVPVPAAVRALALSPSGGLAVVACDDGTLRSLDAGTGEFGATLDSGPHTALSVAVASDAGPVVVAFPDGSVRRYDLAAGTSDIVATSPGTYLVAVTPDGGSVIAAGTDGVLRRWRPSLSPAPDARPLDMAVTAIAADGTGDRVLVGTPAGHLWLHEFTGSSATEFGAWLARMTGSRGIVDEDVRFTVYRPQALIAGTWASLLVFAHKTDLVVEPGQLQVDPVKQVEEMARAHFGDTPVRQGSEDARGGVFRGARLRIVADLPGIRCAPGEAELDWREPVHQVLFMLLAGPDLIGSVIRGAVRIWHGPLLMGEVSLAINVTASQAAAPPAPVTEPATRYYKIFPSYSHRDHAIVDGFADVVNAIGDPYLQDVLTLRSGERWRDRLSELIEQADIFQLFWSSNSMHSQECRKEWEYALALGRPAFIRPVYWEDPLPRDPAVGLPPAALAELHFVKFPLRSADGERPAPATEAGPVPDGGEPAAAGPAPGPAPGSGHGAPRPVRRRRRNLLTGGFAVATGTALIAAFVTTTTLGGHAHAGRPLANETAATSAATSSPPVIVPGLASLASLLPRDIDDLAAQCTSQRPPFSWTMPGLVQALACDAPGLPGGRVYAFQVRTAADYQTTWASFNKWWGFDTASAGTNCPPGNNGHHQGRIGWHGNFFPARDGQVIECQWVGSGSTPDEPAYAWTYPSENAFIVAQGAPGTTFSALDTWWTDESSPLASPTPAA